MLLVDIGLNLTHRSFASDVPQVLERAHQAGVIHMVVTGTSLRASRSGVALAKEYPELLSATAGVHPHDAKHWDDSSAAELYALAKRPPVVAVGECGLDFDRDFSPRADQERCFEAQLEVAAELSLPVFLHERRAHERFIDILRRFRPQLSDIVVHCFTGSRSELRSYLDLDAHIGITGWICDERRGADLQRIVGDIPPERLMIETDAPFLTPRDLKPKPPRRNEPAFLPHIMQAVARYRGDDPDALSQAVAATTCRFFGLEMYEKS